MTATKIKIPIYYGTLTIIQVDNLKKIEKKYNTISLYGMDGCVFRNHKKNGSSRYVMVFEGKTTAEIVAHEALHLVALIYEDRNIILEIENDEPQCYLLGWIVGKCHKHLKLKK